VLNADEASKDASHQDGAIVCTGGQVIGSVVEAHAMDRRLVRCDLLHLDNGALQADHPDSRKKQAALASTANLCVPEHPPPNMRESLPVLTWLPS
jgi:hypothetical protein